MTKNDIIRKLTSRKFWIAVVGFITPLLLAFVNRQPGVRYAYAINSTNVHIGIPYGKR